MSQDPTDPTRLAQTLEALSAEVARLNARLDALEGVAGFSEGAVKAADEKRAMGLDQETLLVISAAIAAFLGKRPHIRQIRLLGSPAWAQQGRVTIQASHDLAVQHG